MKIYTVKDLETFEKDRFRRLICPSGDYTQIKSFDEHCIFGEYCVFGEGCSFGKYCSFGRYCIFGKCCSFGDGCSFGNVCNFGALCNFGKRCRFGEGCNLDNNFKFENIPDQIDRVLKIDRIGSRRDCTYFFRTLSEIYVRCGCFFGTISEFESKVLETHKNNKQYLTEYTEAIRYAKIVLQGGQGNDCKRNILVCDSRRLSRLFYS